MNEATRPLPDAVEDEYEIDLPNPNRRRWTISSLRGIVGRWPFVEPVMLLTMGVASIMGNIQTNAVEVQYCKAVLGIDDSDDCLNNTSQHFIEVQKYASTFSVYQTLCDTVFPLLISIFVGPWSDKFGRRPIILSSSIGFLLSTALWAWATATKLHPNYFLLFGLPSSLSGGTMLAVSAMFCYVCDVTKLEVRARRLGMLQGMIYIGGLIGIVAAPRFIKISYTFAYVVCVYTSIVKLLYVAFLLKESVDTSETLQTPVSWNPIQWCYIRNLYEACYLKQTSHTFSILIYVGLLGFVSLTEVFGEGGVFYLFLQKILGWTLSDTMPLNCTSVIASACVAFFGTWFMSGLLGFADMQVLNIANGIRLVGALIVTFGRQIWLIYFGMLLRSVSGLYGAVMKLFLSRMVSPDDMGKIFALYGTLDILAPLIGALIYNSVYNTTISTYPNTIFLISAFLCCLLTIFTAKIVCLHLRPSDGYSITGSIN